MMTPAASQNGWWSLLSDGVGVNQIASREVLVPSDQGIIRVIGLTQLAFPADTFSLDFGHRYTTATVTTITTATKRRDAQVREG
jgi:hypothetical protein